MRRFPRLWWIMVHLCPHLMTSPYILSYLEFASTSHIICASHCGTRDERLPSMIPRTTQSILGMLTLSMLDSTRVDSTLIPPYMPTILHHFLCHIITSSFPLRDFNLRHLLHTSLLPLTLHWLTLDPTYALHRTRPSWLTWCLLTRYPLGLPYRLRIKRRVSALIRAISQYPCLTDQLIINLS